MGVSKEKLEKHPHLTSSKVQCMTVKNVQFKRFLTGVTATTQNNQCC